MQILGGGIANITSIPNRSHSALQNLGNDDHIQYDIIARMFGSAVAAVGLDASKSATPAVGNLYWATDTNKAYACFATNVWTQVGAVLPPATPTTGDVLAWDGAKWARIAAAGINKALLGQGVGVLPAYGIAPGGSTFMTNTGAASVATGGGSGQFTSHTVQQLYHITATYAGDCTFKGNYSCSLQGTIVIRLYKNGVDTGINTNAINSGSANFTLAITGLAVGDVVSVQCDMTAATAGANFQMNSSEVDTALVMHVGTDSNPVLFSSPSWVGGTPSAGITITIP